MATKANVVTVVCCEETAKKLRHMLNILKKHKEPTYIDNDESEIDLYGWEIYEIF